jgi:phage shock protein PspC (stress-responsive transcriptional regulator)
MGAGSESERELAAARREPRVSRSRQGRVLGGVCAGLPVLWGLRTGGLRVLFVLAALCGGIGVVLYLACWLVIPVGGEDAEAESVRSVVLLAWSAGGLVALVLVAAAAAAATVFGLGWVVFGLAGLALLVAAAVRVRIASAVALATVAALTLPAAAVALSRVRLPLQPDPAVSRPANAADLHGHVFRSGFSTLLIDLRHASLPQSGALTLRVAAGLRRTIVALPTDRCIRVRVNYDVDPFASHLASLLVAHKRTVFKDVVLFGDLYGAASKANPHGTAVAPASASGPTLTIDFRSQGGGLFVRDYPNDVSPDDDPGWPGFPVTPESRPHLRGVPRKEAQIMLRHWRQRHRAQLANQRLVNHLRPGPCMR